MNTRGRKIRNIARVLAAITGMVLVAGYAVAQDEAVVVATEVEGEVTMQAPGDDEWQPVAVDDVIPLESRISTGFDSEAQLAVGENAVVTALELTRMSIDELIQEEGTERSEINLDIGRINGDIERREDQETEFQVRSEVATASVRGTSFGFDGARVWVGEGQVAMINAFGREVNIFPSEESSTDGSSSPSSPREQRREASRINPYTERGGEQASAPSGTSRSTTTGDGTLTIEFDFPSGR